MNYLCSREFLRVSEDYHECLVYLDDHFGSIVYFDGRKWVEIYHTSEGYGENLYE